MKNGIDFNNFSIKTTDCHVDVLQPTPVADVLNMTSLLVKRGCLERIQEQKMINVSD